jgi:hypothetical protein
MCLRSFALETPAPLFGNVLGAPFRLGQDKVFPLKTRLRAGAQTKAGYSYPHNPTLLTYTRPRRARNVAHVAAFSIAWYARVLERRRFPTDISNELLPIRTFLGCCILLQEYIQTD